MFERTSRVNNFYFISSTDILGLIILFFLAYLLKRNEVVSNRKTNQYIITVYLTIIIIILEILNDYFELNASSITKIPLLIVNVFGFTLMFILPIVLGMLYSEKITKIHKLLAIPSAIGAILCVCSIWTGWIFDVNTQGVYSRGDFFYLNIIISIYGLCILALAHFELAKEYERSEKVYLWTLYFIILGTSIMQVIDKNIEIMWGAISICELLYYVFLRELQFKYDVVTGVRNRYSFELEMKRISPDEKLFIVEFDINNLKIINDNFGHESGDVFLVHSVEIIKESFGKYGRIYRTGGDEFVVIAKNCTLEKIESAREHMRQILKEEESKYHFKYYIANAYSQFKEALHKDVFECLKDADRKMYIDKANSKDSI